MIECIYVGVRSHCRSVTGVNISFELFSTYFTSSFLLLCLSCLHLDTVRLSAFFSISGVNRYSISKAYNLPFSRWATKNTTTKRSPSASSPLPSLSHPMPMPVTKTTTQTAMHTHPPTAAILKKENPRPSIPTMFHSRTQTVRYMIIQLSTATLKPPLPSCSTISSSLPISLLLRQIWRSTIGIA